MGIGYYLPLTYGISFMADHCKIEILHRKKPKYHNMRNTIKLLALLCASMLAMGIAHAQTSVNTGGGDATGNGGTVSYSVGQVVYTSISGADGSVAQGIQVAYEIFAVGVDELSQVFSLTAYPNPAVDFLTLRIDDFTYENIFYQLYDLQGRLLKSEEILGEETQIDMGRFPSATYVLQVIQDNKRVQTFKIIKN